jgi:hypothetical protein
MEKMPPKATRILAIGSLILSKMAAIFDFGKRNFLKIKTI